jgi:hypothetical protein
MGLEETQKQKFDMKLTNTAKQRGQLVQIGRKWCNRLNRDNFKIKLTQPATFGRKHHSPPYNICCDSSRGYIQMAFFPATQNWDSYYFSTLDIHIFKSSLFGSCKGNILYPLKRSFQRCMACSNWSSFDFYLKRICG